MRFSIITDTFAPEINGVAMTLEKLANGLLAAGHRIEVIHPRHPELAATEAEAITAAPPERTRLRQRRIAGLPLPGYPQVRLGMPKPFFLASLWRRRRPDAIYVATEGLLGLSALRAARLCGIPVLSGYHTHFPEYLRSYRLPALENLALNYLRRMHNRTQLTFTPSDDVAEQLRADGFDNVRVLGRGVDCRQFSPEKRDALLRQSWGVREPSPVAICVGRVAPEKNLPLAIESVRRLRGHFPDLRLVVVGDGPALPELRAAHPDIVWAGARRGEALAAHYASADLFLFPSLSETYGNVLVEAMASGLPSVSFRYAASLQHVTDGVSGYAVDPGRQDLFFETTLRALRDRHRWPDIGGTARAKAQTLSWGAVVSRFEAALVAAASGGRIDHRQTTTEEHHDENTRHPIQDHLPVRRAPRLHRLQDRSGQ